MKIPSPFFLSPKPVALAVSALMTGLMVTACGGDSDNTGPVSVAQPVITAQAKTVITVDGRQFKDLNGNGKLDPYEDWRLTVEQRVDDLVSKMSLEEKPG
jgi:beta-glucosidase